MKITNEYIKSLDPCVERLNNYLENYKDKDFSIPEFLSLDKISYLDKIWVWKKFTTINEAAIFGLKCAESVLHIFEEKYPLDSRPRQALKELKKFIKNPSKKGKENLKKSAAAAHDAAATAYAAAAYAAADAHAAAAAYAAYAAAAADATDAHAAAAAYAATAYAAAATDATDATDAHAAAAAYAATAYAAAAYAAADAHAAAAEYDVVSFNGYAGIQQQKNIQFLIEIYNLKGAQDDF